MRRRRFLFFAAAAGLVGAGRTQRWEWRGSVMGAEARILLTGEREAAEEALDAAAAEIGRLDAIFSLYRPDSQLSRLNAIGSLDGPAHDLTAAIAEAERWRRATEGAFDAAVQPLWTAAVEGRATLPRAHTGNTDIALAPGRVDLPEGMQLTLNGIAQGIVADRVAAMIVARGYQAPVIDAGEMVLPGHDWRKVALPMAGVEVEVADSGVATSEPGALRLGKRHHLFDPRTGLCPDYWQSVTAIAPNATAADALSTACAVSEPERVGDLVPDGCQVIATAGNGRVHRFGRSEGVRA